MEKDYELDELDYTILTHLQKDGRKSFTEIADELNVAISTVRNRYNRLIEDKILKIIGRAEPNKLGFNAYSRVIIAVKPAKFIENVLYKLSKLPEISFLGRTSGPFNIELNLMCKNNPHLIKTLEYINNIEGVQETQTTMYLKVIKWSQPDINAVKKNFKEIED